MKQITWQPETLGVGERPDHLLALILHDPGETTQVPLGRVDAHKIGTELVTAAALTAAEIAALEPSTNGDVLQ